MRSTQSHVAVREILADSHISAVAIALLLLWSIHSGFLALWGPLYRGASFLLTAIAILDVPYVSRTFTPSDRMLLVATLSNFFNALASLAAAWLLSSWIYGVGPLRSLKQYRTKLPRRDDVG